MAEDIPTIPGLGSPLVHTDAKKSYYPDATLIPARDVAPEALVHTLCTPGTPLTGDAPLMRVPWVREDAEAVAIAEGEGISESVPELAELTFSSYKVAMLTRVSNEATSSTVASNLLAASIERSVTAKLDAMFLKGDTAFPDAPGLLRQDYISQMASGSITGKPEDGVDGLLYCIGTIGERGGSPSNLLMSVSTWARLLRIKDANNNYVISRDVASAPAPVLFGLPITFNAQVTDGTILVLDKRIMFASVSDVSVVTDSSYYFQLDSVAVRATCRIGWGCTRPDLLGVVQVTRDATKVMGVKVAAKA